MRRAVPLLTALLVGQVALAALLYGGGEAASDPQGGALAEVDTRNADAVRIASDAETTLRLDRGEDDSWTVPAVDGFPADPARIERLLNQLGGMDAVMPVANSESARTRLRVATDQYERRIELIADGEPQATVYFGESAGTGRVYARAEGEDAIYEVEFALWETTAEAAKWLDRSVPAVQRQRIRQVQLPDFQLRRNGPSERWQVVDNGAVRPASVDQASQLLGRLNRPQIEGVARAESPEGEADWRYTLTTHGGERVRFRYFRADGEGEPAYLYRQGQPWRYEVAQSRLVALTETAPDKLLAGQSSGEGSQGASAQAKAQAGSS